MNVGLPSKLMPDQNSDPESAALTLVTNKPQALTRSAPAVADMLQSVIEKGISTENVSALEQLVKLYERMQDRDAEKDFAQAFNALQAEMKAVKAMKPVPNSDGTVRYKFAPYEIIMRQVSPLLEKHGFTVTFSTKFEEGRLIKSCTLQHRGGHSRTNEFAVRIGKGPPGSSESQADGAASTYAKRFALCDALNIICEIDSDARIEGPPGPITAQQARDLEERIDNCQADKVAFLKLAGAASFADISVGKLDLLEQLLAKKERAYMSKLEGKK